MKRKIVIFEAGSNTHFQQLDSTSCTFRSNRSHTAGRTTKDTKIDSSRWVTRGVIEWYFPLNDNQCRIKLHEHGILIAASCRIQYHIKNNWLSLLINWSQHENCHMHQHFEIYWLRVSRIFLIDMNITHHCDTFAHVYFKNQ